MVGEKKAAATKYHRKTLLSAADRLLVEHGYDGMNMNMLAKEAGYSKATVYVYFRSKDEMVCALAADRLALLRKELALVVKSDLDKADKLNEVRGVFTEFATEDGAYFDFVATRAAEVDESDGNTFKEAQRLLGEVRGIFDDLCALESPDELKARWYAFYGMIKTKKLMDAAGEA